ncbi:MAG: hypothetical protein A2275_03500 [Bacteroidetes bacterium RIFOXYA12_FULL_35_11]|nr:MAG: hypothetical protein A2X01_05540 [Bacteroidetes bacterium GWF2_35_48]OFY81935.1 MAG: hypothetical protein A2275_03500 [Bacteroidetes bacterium RIFOXYA12_FULL_35_11]HBX52218.1 hypothetical protein [Bacteroidales bacterium]
MKNFLSLLFFLFVSGNLLCQSVLLDKLVTVSRHSATIDVYLKEISAKGNFTFTYSNTQIPLDKKVFIINRTQKVSAILDILFKNYDVEYIERYNKIILKPLSSALKTINISGIVKDKSCDESLAGVNIKVYGSSFGAQTDQQGVFRITVPVHKNTENFKLIISHISYKSDTVIVPKSKINKIAVFLESNILDIPEINIFGVPQIAFGNTEFHIYDYEILQDNILLIVYEKRLSKSNLLLVNKDLKLSCIREIGGTPVGMYKDCVDDVNLITFYKPYKLTLKDECLSFVSAKQTWLNKIHKPCVAKTKAGLLFYYYYGPTRLSVDFSFYNPVTKKDSVFRQITDTISLNELKENLEKNTQGQQNARGNMADIKIGDWDGDDRLSFETASDVEKKKQLYTPMIFLQDSLFIFNHCEGLLEIYNNQAKHIRSVNISYQDSPDWKRKVYIDNATKKIYTLFFKNNHYEVTEIDKLTGALGETCKLHYTWVDKIQVHEGNVYFLYKPAQYNFRKCLYKQKL